MCLKITDKSKKGLGYSAVPPPHPLIYNRLKKLDLSYSGLDEFKEPKFKGYGPENSEQESNVVCDKKSDNSKKNSFESLIEEQGKPQHDDKGFIDSGCSRHMTGNIAYLSDFKEFDGGYVAFRGGMSKEVGTPRYLSLVVPLKKVGDKTVHKKLGDRMERDATTASSLEAEQDSGSGPRCQDTIIGDVNAQTRFEITSKQSNDPPLSRGYTLGSGEDSMKLLENFVHNCHIRTERVSWLKLVLPVFVYAVKHMLMLPVQVSAVEVQFSSLIIKIIIMSSPKFAETHNVVAFLVKPKESDGFAEIIDFLKASSVHYALTVNPIIYTSCIEQFWATAKVQTINGVRQLQALVDKKRVIVTESSIRRDLHLDDAEGTDCLPTATIFEELARMGYEKPSQKLTFYKAFFSPQWKYFIHTITQCLSAKSTAWNEFSSLMASLIICLATNQKFNLSKYIFDAMVKHLDGGVKFLMYLRFLQVFINQQLGDMSIHKKIFVNPFHTKKVFANMKRAGKDFSGRITPLFDTMMVQASEEVGEDSDHPTDSTQITIIDQPSTFSKPNKKQTSKKTQRQEAEVPQDETEHKESVLDLEKAKDAQAKEIAALKKRIQRLERKKNSGPTGLKRLKKVDLDKDDDVTLVDETQERQDDELITAGEAVTTASVEDSAARLLAERLQSKEREELTDEEKGKLFMELMEKRRKHFVALRAQEKRNRPPTKAQKRPQMSTYLKHMGGYTYKQLKGKSFYEIQKLFDKEMKRVNTFVAMGYEV
ncbi:hypothetical protein Tco_0845239 [Tanacetum coccineum]